MKKVYLLFIFAFSLFAPFTYAQFSIQKCVIEVHTGSWCQFCPDADVILEQVVNTHPNAIPVNVHVGDSMEIADGVLLANFYSPAYPQATLNRQGSPINRGTWLATTATILSGASTVTVDFDSVVYNIATRQVDVYLKATFTGTVTGDLRFNCIIVEDSVTGNGTGYNQVNYYNTSAGHPYFGAGNPIINFQHRYVARNYVGGVWGTPGIIPASVGFGDQYTHHYTYTLPVNYDEEQITVVGMVTRYDGPSVTDRVILNANSQDLPIPVNGNTGVETLPTDIHIYPNPVHTSFQISNYTAHAGEVMEIINVEGKSVQKIIMEEPKYQPIINVEHLPAGIYFVQCNQQRFKIIKV